MAHYQIISSEGVDMGVYQGATEAEAVRAMLADAGAASAEPDPGLRVEEIADVTATLVDLIAMVRDADAAQPGEDAAAVVDVTLDVAADRLTDEQFERLREPLITLLEVARLTGVSL